MSWFDFDVQITFNFIIWVLFNCLTRFVMKKILVFVTLFSFMLTPAFAEEKQTEETVKKEKEVYTLDKLEVEDERKESGKAVIDSEALKLMPTRSGSITEALKGQSNVQFDYNSNASGKGGEIRPPRVSISGARPYENNYMIDGSSVTNNLNPSGLKDDDNIQPNDTVVQGGDQTIFYDADMLDSIEVYTSNIPAKYGQFVGGVVDASLREPASDEWHFMLKGMNSSDQWAHIRNKNGDSQTSEDQTEWNVWDLSFRAEGPVNDKLSIMSAYSRKDSTIPLKRIDRNGTYDKSDDTLREDDQERINENYFLKTVYKPTDRLTISVDGTFAPYSEKRWLKNYDDSYYESYNDSYRLGSKINYKMDSGALEGRLVYSENGYSRDADSNFYYTYYDKSTDDRVDKGNYGDSESENKTIDAAFDYNSNEMNLKKNLVFNYSLGLNFNKRTTDIWNEESVADWVSKTPTMTQRRLTTYEEHSQSDDLITLGAYLQSTFKMNKVSLFPGVRVDYDDFAENYDFAPRFKAEYDLYGDGSARIIAGANRYYGSSLRSFAFDQRRQNETRIMLDFNGDGKYDFDNKSINDADYDMDGLSTPYSDELSLGVVGEAFQFSYGVEYIHRNHEDQLVSIRNKETKEYVMTNDGESRYEGVTVTVSRPLYTNSFGNHNFSLSATQSRSKTFNGSYNSQIDLVGNMNYDDVFYKGGLRSRSDLPATNYSSPLVITFGWMGSFFDDRLRLNTTTRWRDSSKGLIEDERESKDTPFGTRYNSKSNRWMDGKGNWVYAYEKGTINGGWNTDMTVEMDVIKKDITTLTLIAQVSNLFQDKTEGIKSSSGGIVESDGVNMGRSFYLGVRAEF